MVRWFEDPLDASAELAGVRVGEMSGVGVGEMLGVGAGVGAMSVSDLGAGLGVGVSEMSVLGVSSGVGSGAGGMSVSRVGVGVDDVWMANTLSFDSPGTALTYSDSFERGYEGGMRGGEDVRTPTPHSPLRSLPVKHALHPTRW